jgi:hypothetical protein
MEIDDILIILIIANIIILIIYLYFKNIFFEQLTEPQAKYFTKDELYEYLIKDEDNYFKNFSDKDFKVRNVRNLAEYYNKIKEACIDIDVKHKNILNKCIATANKKLTNYSRVGFNGEKCANIKWKIGLIKNKLYEEGFPHTRNDVIIIPLNSFNNKKQLINTLIHEKIHVYQKKYNKDIEEYLEANGFTKYELRSSFNNSGINTRSNPDMDEWIYKNNKGEIMMAEYNDNPSSIMDVKTHPIDNYKYEHPFEFMAYNITNDIN